MAAFVAGVEVQAAMAVKAAVALDLVGGGGGMAVQKVGPAGLAALEERMDVVTPAEVRGGLAR